MRNPENTDFNKDQIAGWSEARFKKWWKLLGFDGDAVEWYYKITGKKKKEAE